MAVIRIDVDTWADQLVIRAPYDPTGRRQELLKSHGARWDPDLRVWTASASVLEPLQAFLRHNGDQVVIGATGNRFGGRALAHALTGGNWAEAMFSALPQRLHDDAFKALSRVLHPDVGGDGRAMQQLNDARPKVGAR